MNHLRLLNTLLLTMMTFFVFGQIEIAFTGKLDGYHHPLDSIHIRNLTTGKERILYPPDTLLLITLTTGSENSIAMPAPLLDIRQNYPNPFSVQTNFIVSIPYRDHVFLTLFDLSGRILGRYQGHLEEGEHTFELSKGNAGVFFLEVKTSTEARTIRMISSGFGTSSRAVFNHTGFSSLPAKVDLAQSELKDSEVFEYNEGDLLEVKGYITDSVQVAHTRLITIDPDESKTYFLGFGDKFRIAILMYHELVEGEAEDLYERSMEDFENDMMYLLENDFHLLSINDLLLIERGEMVLQSHGAIVTFDDGFASDYHLAFPLLKELDIPATFFIVTEWVGTTGFLTWPEVWLLSQYENDEGSRIFSIGSHTSSHPFLEQSAENFGNHDDYLAFLNAELGDSKEWIVDVTGQEHIFLALPYGDGAENPHIIETALANGYHGIRTSRWGAEKPFEMDLFVLRSIPILSTSSIDGIQYYLNN